MSIKVIILQRLGSCYDSPKHISFIIINSVQITNFICKHNQAIFDGIMVMHVSH